MHADRARPPSGARISSFDRLPVELGTFMANELVSELQSDWRTNDHAEVMTFTGSPGTGARSRPLCSTSAEHQGDDMQTALRALTARVAEFTRQSFGTYLPWSPLTGIGRASDLAAWHPAFAIDAHDDPRLDN
jgi:hypothetical protein